MVRLADQDILTREVLDWRGVHLLHFFASSCSQKVRIFLGLKGVEWTSHPVDLARGKNYEPWFLGINPRGLVPVLVVDGDVHIESNDIMTWVDETYPGPRLIPPERAHEIAELLKEEDDLHLDLRALTMRFVVPSIFAAKSPSSLETYETEGTGTVGGQRDPRKDVELGFWKSFAEQGISDEQARGAAEAFRDAFDRYDARLAADPYLLGSEISVVDIAWFIYANRLITAGYPLAKLHPRLGNWFERLSEEPAFVKERYAPVPVRAVTAGLHAWQRLTGGTLVQVAGL